MELNNSKERQEEDRSSVKENLNRFREDYSNGRKVIVTEDDGEYD